LPVNSFTVAGARQLPGALSPDNGPGATSMGSRTWAGGADGGCEDEIPADAGGAHPPAGQPEAAGPAANIVVRHIFASFVTGDSSGTVAGDTPCL
jgi:hypothetical protein